MITRFRLMRRGAALAAVAMAFSFAPGAWAESGGLNVAPDSGSTSNVTPPATAPDRSGPAPAAATAPAAAGAPAAAAAAAAASEAAVEPGIAAEVAPEPLSPEAEALRAELVRRLGRNSTAIPAYAERRFEPVWLGADGKAGAKAAALIATLAAAGNQALPVERYDAEGLLARLSAGGPAVEAELTAAYLLYARDIASGVLEPRRVDGELYVFPDRPDAGRLVAEAAAAPDMKALLKSLEPKDPEYARLIAHYNKFRARADGDIWGAPVAKGRTLRPGETDSRVAAARARLVAMGDLDPAVYGSQAGANDGQKVAANDVTTDVPARAVEEKRFDEKHFDDFMVEAVKRFQLRHGLNDDGVIGPATLDQLNTSPSTRAEQIAVNIERLRWLNRDLGDRYIMVNLAGFSMAVMSKGHEVFTSRVVVGKAGKHRTPEFSEMMTHIIVNPSWHVPRSIATKEILPILQRDPTYLERNGMRLVGGEEPFDWNEVTPGTFPGRIVQSPGDDNALGTVKFMFPNRFSIYLHDTPSKRLFSRDVRAFSHGCVRVEKPEEFAAYLLTGQKDDPLGYFRSIRGHGGERRINLENPLPVYLTYRTAWVDATGVDQFRGDVYGRDAKVAQALKDAGVTILQ